VIHVPKELGAAPPTDGVAFEGVSKVFRHRPALLNWMGRERGGDTLALRNISFHIPSSKILVLLGPNGSGKTTTLKLVSTMLLPDVGQVFVAGAMTAQNASEVRRQVGFALSNERSFFPRLSARENLEFFASLDEVPKGVRKQRIEDVLARVELLDMADTLVMKCSSGMYQRLGIARALLKQPAVLLLDEPTRSLDPGSTNHFWKLVRLLAERGTTVMLATHNFNEAVAVGDLVAVLHRGELAAFRKAGDCSVEELRHFYFQATGEVDEAVPMLARNWQSG
jgi:ABC-2 type transport system ATP-binding protein